MSPCDLETSVSVCVVCVHLCVVVYVCVGKQGLTNGVVLERQKSFVQLVFISPSDCSQGCLCCMCLPHSALITQLLLATSNCTQGQAQNSKPDLLLMSICPPILSIHSLIHPSIHLSVHPFKHSSLH